MARHAVILKAWDGSTWFGFRIPSDTGDMNGVTIDSIATVWTPAAGKIIRLMGGSFSVDAAVSVVFTDSGDSSVLWRTPVLVANTPYNFDRGPKGVPLSAADALVKATGSGAADITGTLYGIEEDPNNLEERGITA